MYEAGVLMAGTLLCVAVVACGELIVCAACAAEATYGQALTQHPYTAHAAADFKLC